MADVTSASISAIQPGPDTYSTATLRQWQEDLNERRIRELVEGAWCIVAEIDARVVGFVALDRDELSLLYVHPSSNGQGVGRALMVSAMRQAHAAGRTRIWMDASRNGAGFYARLGFTDEGDVDHTGPSGNVVRCRRMTLIL